MTPGGLNIIDESNCESGVVVEPTMTTPCSSRPSGHGRVALGHDTGGIAARTVEARRMPGLGARRFAVEVTPWRRYSVAPNPNSLSSPSSVMIGIPQARACRAFPDIESGSAATSTLAFFTMLFLGTRPRW